MGADADLRSTLGSIPPGIDFDHTPLAAAPPLSEATVAIVTTAALAKPGEPWVEQSADYRVFAADDHEVVVGHNSTNFDRVGLTADLNVAYPIDRLAEMAADGTIGGVGPENLSVLGSTFDLSTFRLDTGPAMAQRLLAAGVDVVLLTPV